MRVILRSKPEGCVPFRLVLDRSGRRWFVFRDLTHKLILPGFIVASALRNEEPAPPVSLDAFRRDMARAGALLLVLRTSPGAFS